MSSTKKSRVLQVKQSTTDHLKGSQTITKFFQPVIKSDNSSTSNIIVNNFKNKPGPPQHCRYREVDGVVILSDISDDETNKVDNQENHQVSILVEEISSASLSSSFGSDMKLKCTPVRAEPAIHHSFTGKSFSLNDKMNPHGDARNLFSSMNHFFESSSSDGSTTAGNKSQSLGKAHRNSLSGKRPNHVKARSVKKQLSSPAKISSYSLSSDAKRKQRTMDSYVSPKKTRLEPSSSNRSTPRTLSPNFRSQPCHVMVDLTRNDSEAVQKRTASPRLLKEKMKPRRTTSSIFPTTDPSSEKENASDCLFDMYDLFPVTRAGSLSPNSVVSLSDDEGDMPQFIPTATADNPPHSETLSPRSPVIDTFNLDSKKVENPFSNSPDIPCTSSSTLALPPFENKQDRQIDHTAENWTVTVNPMDAPKTSEDDESLSSDEEIFSTPKEISLSQTRKVLKKLGQEAQPITPRRIKRDRECVELQFLSEDESEHDQAAPKPKKVTYTLNKLLKDKKQNEELKHMEAKLIADIKKGGFARVMDNTSSDDELKENGLGDDIDFGKVVKIFSSNEDCLGVEESHKSFRIFSRKRVFCSYCRHQISIDESISLMLSQEVDTRSRLNCLIEESGTIFDYLDHCRGDLAADKDCALNKIFSWLIQILSTHADTETLRLAEKLLTLLTAQSKTKFSYTACFYEALCNLGIKEEFLHNNRKSHSSSCQKCQSRKRFVFVPLGNVLSLLKVFRLYCFKYSLHFDDVELYELVTTFILLSASQDIGMAATRTMLHDCIEIALKVIKNWPKTMYKIIAFVTKKLDDIHTLRHVTTMLPSNTDRSAQLRRTFAYVALNSRIDSDDMIREELVQDAKLQLSHVAKLATKMAVYFKSMLRSSMLGSKKTERQLYNTLWACTSLLQTCMGSESVHYSQRSNLESIIESLRSLSMSIKDNSSLYRSEAKYYIGIPTALGEFQLQAMPKSQLYQQGIFKYLSTSRVDEEIVQDENTDESDDCYEMAEEDLASSEPCQITANHLPIANEHTSIVSEKHLPPSEPTENDHNRATSEERPIVFGDRRISEDDQSNVFEKNLTSGTIEQSLVDQVSMRSKLSPTKSERCYKLSPSRSKLCSELRPSKSEGFLKLSEMTPILENLDFSFAHYKHFPDQHLPTNDSLPNVSEHCLNFIPNTIKNNNVTEHAPLLANKSSACSSLLPNEPEDSPMLSDFNPKIVEDKSVTESTTILSVEVPTSSSSHPSKPEGHSMSSDFNPNERPTCSYRLSDESKDIPMSADLNLNTSDRNRNLSSEPELSSNEHAKVILKEGFGALYLFVRN